MQRNMTQTIQSDNAVSIGQQSLAKKKAEDAKQKPAPKKNKDK